MPDQAPDFTRNPYRGVLAEVARREGVSRQAIHQALRTGNVRVTALVRRAIKARAREMTRAQTAGLTLVPAPSPSLSQAA